MLQVYQVYLALAIPLNIKFFLPNSYCEKINFSLSHDSQQRPASHRWLPPQAYSYPSLGIKHFSRSPALFGAIALPVKHKGMDFPFNWRYVRRLAFIIDSLLQQTTSNQHYAKQNSDFLILDCLVSKEYDKDFLY